MSQQPTSGTNLCLCKHNILAPQREIGAIDFVNLSFQLMTTFFARRANGAMKKVQLVGFNVAGCCLLLRIRHQVYLLYTSQIRRSPRKSGQARRVCK